MPSRTRTACVGLEAHRAGEGQITCELCGQTLQAIPVWYDPISRKKFTAELGYFREYRGIILRAAF